MAAELAETGRTPMMVAVDGTVAGVIAVADEISADATAMVADPHAAGVRKIIS